MKDGTENLIKFKLLQRDLGLKLWECRGLLDSIWKFTKDNCPAGDIGRFSAEEIAVAIDWDRCPPEKMMDALVRRRWIDHVENHGCRVHDWPHHCESSVHRTLAMQGLTFADGTEPSDSKLTGDEKKRAVKRKELRNAGAARMPHGDPTDPILTDPILTKPDAAYAAKQGSGFSNSETPESRLTIEVLRSTERFESYIAAEEARSDGWLDRSESDRTSARAVAAKVTTDPKIHDPVAVAKWILKRRRWNYLSATHDEIAKAMRREQRAQPPPDSEVSAAVNGLAEHTKPRD